MSTKGLFPKSITFRALQMFIFKFLKRFSFKLRDIYNIETFIIDIELYNTFLIDITKWREKKELSNSSSNSTRRRSISNCFSEICQHSITTKQDVF